MTIFEKIAKEYVESYGEVLTGIKFDFDNRKDFFFEIYYDFVFVNIKDNKSINSPIAGGAVGFTIDKKTHVIKTLSFSDLGILECTQKRQEDLYQKIKNIDENTKLLSWLKFEYGLNSIELLKMKRIIKGVNFTKQNALKELDELLRKSQVKS